MPYPVVFAPEAEEQLIELYRYIAEDASPTVAERFTQGLVDFCEGLAHFPQRALRRDDIRPGLHITNYRGRVVVAYVVDSNQVSVLGLFYGGRDFESLLAPDEGA